MSPTAISKWTLLPTLPTGYVQYFGVQLPDGSLVILTEALKSDKNGLQGNFVPFQNIQTIED